MIIKEKTVCFSGHRRERLPRKKEEMEELQLMVYEEIERAIKEGFETYLMGACYGFDLLCAEMVLLHKKVVKLKEPRAIKLIAAVPFEAQPSRWKESDREKYFDILEKCDDVIYVSKRYSMDCYHKRNRFMVDNSSRLICYYDGGRSGTGYTVNYAKENKCEVINLYI